MLVDQWPRPRPLLNHASYDTGRRQVRCKCAEVEYYRPTSPNNDHSSLASNSPHKPSAAATIPRESMPALDPTINRVDECHGSFVNKLLKCYQAGLPDSLTTSLAQFLVRQHVPRWTEIPRKICRNLSPGFADLCLSRTIPGQDRDFDCVTRATIIKDSQHAVSGVCDRGRAIPASLASFFVWKAAIC